MPSQVQQKKGGPWCQWTSGHIESSLLRVKITKRPDPVFINGCSVYGLKFDDKAIWTTEKGWA